MQMYVWCTKQDPNRADVKKAHEKGVRQRIYALYLFIDKWVLAVLQDYLADRH